jgi:hypothetical protein
MRRLQIASRIAASVIGGWVFVWGFTTLGIALLLIAGLRYDDARTLIYLFAFLVYLVAFCWVFATARATRAWLVLLGGGSTMTALAWLLLRSPT